MKIYISGKITGLDLEVARQKFIDAAKTIPLPHVSINPMDILPYAEHLTWHDYMLADIAVLFHCDAILMLPCHTDSKGAKVELAVAQALGLQIFYDKFNDSI